MESRNQNGVVKVLLPVHKDKSYKQGVLYCVQCKVIKLKSWCSDFGKVEGQSKATFAALFGLRAGGGVDLSAAYRYNQNMMEYYTCKSVCL